LSRRRPKVRTEARPGFIVAHKGAEIGILERIEVAERTRTLLHVRGGVSGSLEYVIPSTAVVEVHATTQHALIDDRVTFETDTIAEDGRVILLAVVPSHPWRAARAEHLADLP
jgi:hypothetical protein